MAFDVKYDKSFFKRNLSDKEVIVTNLVPRLKTEEKEKVYDAINDILFEVFKKYV